MDKTDMKKAVASLVKAMEETADHLRMFAEAFREGVEETLAPDVCQWVIRGESGPEVCGQPLADTYCFEHEFGDDE